MSSRFNRTLIAPHPPYVCTKRLPFPVEIGPCCPYQLNAFVDVLFLTGQPEHFDFYFAAHIYRVGTTCEYGGAFGWKTIWVEVHLTRHGATPLWQLQLIPYTSNGGYKMWPNPICFNLQIDDIWHVSLDVRKWDAYLPPPPAKRCRCRIKP